MTAADQLNRIVSVVAELSRTGGDASLAELAERFGTSPAQIQADIRALTGLGDHADADWRLSLSVTQQGDQVSIESLGPWRRPLRLTPDEWIALQVALADDADGEPVARKFATLAPKTAEPPAVAHDRPRAEGRVLEIVRRAVTGRQKVEILYAGSQDKVGRQRTIRPHELVTQGGRFYCIAWCESARGWRHFRVDRMLDAALLDTTFEPEDYAPPTVYVADEPDQVTVRFSPAIARWLKERYPDGREADGAWEVTFDVTDPAWLARHVLYFGTEAEVVQPEEYREVMRR